MNQQKVRQAESWSFFDRIYCISLRERSDRREQARKQFAAVGLLERVEFVLVEKHCQNPEKGIFQSHMHCLTKGLKENAEKILVFEDDVFFRFFDSGMLKEIYSSLDGDINWNGFFFGCITDGSCKTAKNHLVEIRYRCLAHAYALDHHFARRLVQEPWSGVPFDELLRLHGENFYAPYPMCAFQGLAGSDNQTVAIDRIRRIFGGLPFIQRANEMYQNHKMVLLLVPSVILVGFGLISYRLW